MQKILIVDDNRALRLVFGERLAMAGYEIIYATNGREGLALAHKHHPAVIILDHQMPIMTGEEMLLTLRQRDVIRQIPVVFMSASLPSSYQSCIDTADIILQKPASTSELMASVNRVLQSHAGV